MMLWIPKVRTRVKEKQLERALAILYGLGAKIAKKDTYGVARLLDFVLGSGRFSAEKKLAIARKLGNLACADVLNVDCSRCPMRKPSDYCIEQLGIYLITKGPKGR